MKTIILVLFVSVVSFAQTKEQDTTYTVKWIVVESITVPYENKPDDYGIISNSVPAIYQFKLIGKPMKKIFNTEKEADQFIKDMPICNDSLNFGGCCRNPIKIKNIKIKEQK